MSLGNPPKKKLNINSKKNTDQNNITIGTTNLINDNELNENNLLKKINQIGPKSKALLRAFKNKKRMTLEQYEAAKIEWNKKVIEKKQDIKQNVALLKEIANLPFVELDLNENKIARKAYQQEQATKKQYKKFEDKFVTGRLSGKSSYNIKLQKQISLLNTIQNSFKAFDKIYPDKKYNLKVNNKFYAVNDNTRTKLYEAIMSDNLQESSLGGSDEEFAFDLQNIDHFSIEIFEPTNTYEKKNGAFFKYTNTTKFNLTKYQIYQNIYDKDVVNVNDLYENCLIYALKCGSLDNSKLETLKLMCNTDNIPICKLNEICNKLEICIKLTRPKYANKLNINETKTDIYGDIKYTTFNIGLLEEHYFINEMTNITAYSIKNYEIIKNEKECSLIYKKTGNYFKYDKKRCITSYEVINLFLQNKESLLKPISKLDVLNSQVHRKVDNIITKLEYKPIEDINYRPVETTEERIFRKSNGQISKTNKPVTNIFYDFETYVDKITKLHIPYLCCYIDDNNNNYSFYGENCGLQMLKHLSIKYKKIRLIAHNASYDIRFLYKYLHNVSEITKGTKILSCKANFNKMTLEFKDSYLLISMPLKKFTETFKINNCVKEVISYDFYNETDAINKKIVNIKDFENYLENESKSIIQFKENLKKWNLILKGDKFDCIEYAKKYCEIDCYILREGYNTFKKWLIELVNIDIDNVLTIASLAHKYFIEQGCYKDVYELSGKTQLFIQNCVVGGRVMCSNNEKIKITDKNLVDFDAVSLYPSAMNRMDGFLKGLPKMIINTDYNDLKHKDGYFVEIEICSVGIKRNLPLSSYINENTGVRNFTNDMIGKRIFIDKIALEDLINYQDIKFNIIRGYYFDDGFNDKINTTIKILFEERKRLKKEKNPAEMVYKLIMNSGYGKSIMKEIETETRYFNNEEEMKVFISRNYNWLINYEKIYDSELYKVKLVKSLIEHFNIAQVGVSILSWSKRIMNEVICLAEDNKIDIYYQDTDSMHLQEKDVDILANLYEIKYNRKLIGKELGQFHSDFDLGNCNNVIATKSIFLGKKCYIDHLQGVNEKGEIENGFHIRMKGVDNGTIKWTAEKLGYNNLFDLYDALYNGKSIEFDLTQGGKKGNFKYNSNGSITTLQEFKRLIKF